MNIYIGLYIPIIYSYIYSYIFLLYIPIYIFLYIGMNIYMREVTIYRQYRIQGSEEAGMFPVRCLERLKKGII